MIIENLRSERGSDRARIAATVHWEESARPMQEIYFETQKEFADDLVSSPHPFLVGCVIPALNHGEKRIFIDEAICPDLRDGLVGVMSIMRHWYHDPDKPLVRIEAKTRKTVLHPTKASRSGVFLSGGVDSFAAMRWNRLNFSAEHPGSFKDGIVVHGFHIQEPDSFREVLDSLSEVAKEVGITPIGIRTNLIHGTQSWNLWTNQLFGAAFSAVAHAIGKRFTTVAIASPGLSFPKKLDPHGSHPLVDPNYSSSDLTIRHDGSALSRLDKIQLIADWDFALKNLRVCNNTMTVRSKALNCGNCEKCVRTKLEFEAVGILYKVPVFLERAVSADDVEPLNLNNLNVQYYEDLLLPLTARGRQDLVSAIKGKIRECQRSERLNRWRNQLRQFDRSYLDGRISHFKHAFLGDRDVA
jgi:hypothetical protein